MAGMYVGRVKEPEQPPVPGVITPQWNRHARAVGHSSRTAESVVKTKAPYFQHATNRQKGCQIDLLVHTRCSIYVCEIKTGNYISTDIIGEIKEKVERLAVPKGMSTRTVLLSTMVIWGTLEEHYVCVSLL
jgi:hypothetical protein